MNDPRPSRTTYGAEPLRAPTPAADETVIYSEHGRIFGNVCYQSHWVMLVRADGGMYRLLVLHGGGQQSFSVGYSRGFADGLARMTSDERYIALYTLLCVHNEAQRTATASTSLEYKQAFAEGRLKKRKDRGRASVKVWIERQPQRSARV